MALIARPMDQSFDEHTPKPRLSCLAEIASQHLSTESDKSEKIHVRTTRADDSRASEEKPYRTRKAASRRGPPMSEAKEFDPLRGSGYRKLPFPIRLFDMIDFESKTEDPILRWTPDGRGFFIQDQDKLVRDVLPKYDFKASKFASIQRNLNIYGFQRVVKGQNAGAYVHPLFHRDMDASTLAKFVRKGCGRSNSSGPAKPSALRSSISVDSEDMDRLTASPSTCASLSPLSSDSDSIDDPHDPDSSSSHNDSSCSTSRVSRKRKSTSSSEPMSNTKACLATSKAEDQVHFLSSFGTGAFPFRLYKLLCTECASNPHVVSWAQEGRCFHIVDEHLFVKDLLPRHGFKASKLASFQRNLNIYSFQRIVKGPDSGAYYHPLFHRNMAVSDLCKITRKTQGQCSSEARVTFQSPQASSSLRNLPYETLVGSIPEPEAYTVRDSLFAIRNAPNVGESKSIDARIPQLEEKVDSPWNSLGPLLLAAQFASRAMNEPDHASSRKRMTDSPLPSGNRAHSC